MDGNGPRSTGIRRVDVTGAAPPITPPPTAASPTVPSTPSTPRPGAPTGPSAASIEALERDVRAGVGAARQSAADLRRSLDSARSDLRASASERAAAQRAADEAARADGLAREAQRHEAAVASAVDAFEASVAALAPGVAASRDGRGEAAGTPRAVRFGTIETPEAVSGAPALAPLLSSTGWYLESSRAEGVDLVVATITRLVTAVPARNLRIITWDPRLRGELGVFAALRSARAAAFPPALTGADELVAALEGLIAVAAENSERIRSAGAIDLIDLWERDGLVGEHVVVVLLDYPAGIDERIHSLVVRLAETAAPRGISLLVQADAAVKPPKDVDLSSLSRSLERLIYRAGRWALASLPDGVTVAADGALDRATIDSAVASAVARAGADTGPSVTLSELLSAEPWTRSSGAALAAPIGRSGKTDLTIELRSENPPLPNILVGGAVGQGKSNLLLAVIYSLAHEYSADELEFLLLDFKQGLEFQRFDRDESGEGWLPHVRVLSLESNRAFGLAVLDHVVEELGRRSEEFKNARANSIDDYRTRTGERMPRLVLVIDEFQMLFDGMDDLTDSAVARLEQLAKQGRAYGIHLLLATQALSGISGLRLKGDAIFAQFPVRISLKNTAEESQALLSTGNRAAAELTYRGEVVVNRNFGLDPEGSNEFGVVAYAEPAAAADLQRRLWERGHSTPPLVFFGSRAAQWPVRDLESLQPGEEREAWIGMPIAISAEPARIRLTADVEQGIAVIGRGDEEAIGVLSSSTATALRGLPPGGRVVLLDGDDAGDDMPAWFTAATAGADRRQLTVRRVRRAGITRYLLDEIAPALAASDPVPTLIVAAGMQRVADLADELLVDPDDEFGPRTSAAIVLQDVAERGALRGVTVIAWWSTPQSASAHLGYNHRGFGSFVLLAMGLDDLRGFVGPHAQRPDGSPRVLLLDRKTGDPEREVVPFDLASTTEAAR